MEVSNIKFNLNPPNGSFADTCWQTDGHDDGKRHLSELRKRA
jgi:hypothetical protein